LSCDRDDKAGNLSVSIRADTLINASHNPQAQKKVLDILSQPARHGVVRHMTGSRE